MPILFLRFWVPADSERIVSVSAFCWTKANVNGFWTQALCLNKIAKREEVTAVLNQLTTSISLQ